MQHKITPMHRYHASIVIKTRTMNFFLVNLPGQFALFLKIYTTDKNFTRPPVAPVAPYINSASDL